MDNYVWTFATNTGTLPLACVAFIARWRENQVMTRFVCGSQLFIAVFTAVACGGNEKDHAESVEFSLQTIADCPDGFNIIEGTNLDDNLRGTNANDCVLGYDGNDVIRGRRGDDYLVGGHGNDEIYGNGGDDQIFGEDGGDTIAGNGGSDAIQGGSGADTLRGGAGHDDVSGGDGADLITGGPGRDVLIGDAGDDEIRGNRGQDFLDGGDGDDLLSGGDGIDTVYGGAGDDTIIDPGGRDIITDNVGDGSVVLSFNTWPVVESIVPSPTRLDVGQSTALSVEAFDPDGDPMTFLWAADCAGTFSEADALEPTFTLGTAESGLCTLTLQIFDARGGAINASITIATGTVDFFPQ